MTPIEYVKERMKLGFERCFIPEHMHDGIRLWVLNGIMPGSFLESVLSNNLKGAVLRADYINSKLLNEYVQFTVNYIPSECQGSEEKMSRWKGIENG